MREDAFFRISNEVRYVALYLDGQLTLRERPALANPLPPLCVWWTRRRRNRHSSRKSQ